MGCECSPVAKPKVPSEGPSKGNVPPALDLSRLHFKKKIEGMNQAQHAAARPAPAPAPAPGGPPGGRADTEFLSLHQESNIETILRGWPDKNNPLFSGAVGEDANEWLQTVEILLGDRQAHPGVWHIAAGRRLSGKLFNHWINSALNNTRPTDWAGFKQWLVKRSPLGPPSAQIADELEGLKQGPSEMCQEFYERFRDWQQKAKAIDFRHDEMTCFVKGLTQGLSKKVSALMLQEHLRGSPMTMDRVLFMALQNDRAFRKAKTVAPVASGLGKRRADGEAGGPAKKRVAANSCFNCKQVGHIAANCPLAKTNAQKAWESAKLRQT